MLKWLKSLFAWRVVKKQSVWIYEENSVTGERRALRNAGNVYSPVDIDWLQGGEILELSQFQ